MGPEISLEVHKNRLAQNSSSLKLECPMTNRIYNSICSMDRLVGKKKRGIIQGSEFRELLSSKIFTHLFIQYILSTEYCCGHRSYIRSLLMCTFYSNYTISIFLPSIILIVIM